MPEAGFNGATVFVDMLSFVNYSSEGGALGEFLANALQLPRHPVVIGVKVAQNIPSGLTYSPIESGGLPLMLASDVANARKPVHYLFGVILRAVIDNNHFIRLPRLGRNTLQALGKKASAIVAGDQDRYAFCH
ncbi:MAG TPA: hypothetical protein VLW84_02485 [Terriglobales bacterium]|nr:hypothetical protein [Terriglobales bacterium]